MTHFLFIFLEFEFANNFAGLGRFIDQICLVSRRSSLRMRG